MSKKLKDPELDSFLKQKKLNDEVLKALSLVLESMAEGVNVSNDKGIILFTNPAFDDVFGYNQDELTGKHVSELTTYSAKQNAQIYREINQILDAKKTWSGEFSNKKKDGTVFYTEARISAVELRGKRCLISVQSDITQRRMMETALQESETKYRIVSENTYDWGYWISPERKFIYLSPSCKRITGHDANEFLTDPNLLYRIIHPEDQPLFVNHRTEAEKQFQSDEIEFRIMRNDGTVRWIGHVCQPVFDNEGNFLGTRASNRDLTKRKLAEQELKRSNADLQQFAFAASHDLQEPLRGIESFIRLLEKRYKGRLDEKADEFIDFIIDDVKRMQVLIKDLLEYSRLSAKDKVIRPVNCSVILEQALNNLRSAIGESNAALTYDSLPVVMGDEAQLIRLFQNLIGNAIKFRSRELPKVHISARREGNEWLFSVRDNGIGIDPKQAERIFVIFQRLHARQEYPGTGIGLAVCKRIVERHGGRIWAESEPGKGAVFFFTVPDRQRNP